MLPFSLVYSLAFAQKFDPEPEPGPSFEPKNHIRMEQGEPYYEWVDEATEFPGGMLALRKFLADNLEYPERPLKDSVEGKCYVKLLITDRGEIRRAIIMKNLTDYPEFGAEALRVMYLMPRWKSGKVNGKNVNSYYRIPVTFKLNQIK